MSCYCPTCEDFVQPAEGGESDEQDRIIPRTKGYSIFGVVNAKMFSAAVILVVIALGLKNPQLILDSDILCVFALCGAVALFWILRYWKHWLDIFKKDLVLFEGEVFFRRRGAGIKCGKPLGKLAAYRKGNGRAAAFCYLFTADEKAISKQCFDPGYVPWAGFVFLSKADEMYCRYCEYFYT